MGESIIPLLALRFPAPYLKSVSPIGATTIFCRPWGNLTHIYAPPSRRNEDDRPIERARPVRYTVFPKYRSSIGSSEAATVKTWRGGGRRLRLSKLEGTIFGDMAYDILLASEKQSAIPIWKTIPHLSSGVSCY